MKNVINILPISSRLLLPRYIPFNLYLNRSFSQLSLNSKEKSNLPKYIPPNLHLNRSFSQSSTPTPTHDKKSGINIDYTQLYNQISKIEHYFKTRQLQIFGFFTIFLGKWFTSGVVTKTLAQDAVKAELSNISTHLVHDILTDPNTLLYLENNLVTLFESKRLEASIELFLTNLLNSELLQKKFAEFSKKVTTDPAVIDHVSNLLIEACSTPEAFAFLEKFFNELTKDTENIKTAEEFCQSILDQDLIRDSSVEHLSSVLQEVLNDPNVALQIKKTILEILTSDEIQKKAGVAIWSAFKYILGASNEKSKSYVLSNNNQIPK